GGILIAAAAIAGYRLAWWIGVPIGAIALYHLSRDYIPKKVNSFLPLIANAIAVVLVGIILANHWLPLGSERGAVRNLVFVACLIGGLLLFFRVFQKLYPTILGWCLRHKIAFLSIPGALVVLAVMIWLGFGRVFYFVPERFKANTVWSSVAHSFPGLGKEFMPPLDEGSYLYMPTTMPHASIGECLDILQKQDIAFQSIPEIDSVVGKIGRVESPLDPAPISMVETIINYKPEYISDKDGRRIRFQYDKKTQDFVRDDSGELIRDRRGKPFRQWRDHIKSPDDIWDEIVKAGQIPGTTSAPKLQPIATRIIMLQSGMRAPMGVKVKGPDLDTIDRVGLEIERLLKDVPSVEPTAVIADRIVGKPYIEIDIDRDAIARYGIHIRKIQDVIEVAIGGRRITTTVEGRERYGVRVRYVRELRDQIESLDKILVPAANGPQIPLIQLADIRYVRGPQAIKSEDTFLIGYVLFDKKTGHAEVDVVEECQAYLKAKIESGEFVIPDGVSYAFAGSYENQIRAARTLSVVVPLALFIIFIILYLQFKSTVTSLLVFSGIIVAWSGGFLMIWLYGQDWFLDFNVFGVNMRELFGVHTINLSVAIWVGFLALFGIASDDGVVMCTYLKQSFEGRKPASVEETRRIVIEAGKRRIRPCLMTTATTILALIPVLTSTGRGADIMVPMAIPSFGGMTIEILTMLVVPVLYSSVKEFKSRS
ncbi:MAG: efflux RND transporter permease subunit, partial [Planctomycetota bacterium]